MYCADVLNQTPDESFSLHIDLALAAVPGDEQVRAVLLLVAQGPPPRRGARRTSMRVSNAKVGIPVSADLVGIHPGSRL